ncbi:hypothetical protein DEJ11_15160 [Curtobacterium sp. MCLR17_058]|nr:hypothetical protein [Curtobacterium sp. MCLR17_058]WIB42153.1 hypothetical protein DEJ11_15160 [Curtobacterium sp. MCLR17_058]
MRAWDAEHIVPKRLHPEFMFTPENLALSCPDCNGPKWDKETLVDPTLRAYPLRGDAFLIVHPHFDAYEDHIVRGDYVYTAVEGSEKGAWTIIECNLGRFVQMQIGWPEPLGDEDFEDEVERAASGDAAAVSQIAAELRQ